MNPEDAMRQLEEFAKISEFFTGARNQLIDQGWDKSNAERLIIETIAKGTPQHG